MACAAPCGMSGAGGGPLEMARALGIRTFALPISNEIRGQKSGENAAKIDNQRRYIVPCDTR